MLTAADIDFLTGKPIEEAQSYIAQRYGKTCRLLDISGRHSASLSLRLVTGVREDSDGITLLVCGFAEHPETL